MGVWERCNFAFVEDATDFFLPFCVDDCVMIVISYKEVFLYFIEVGRNKFSIVNGFAIFVEQIRTSAIAENIVLAGVNFAQNVRSSKNLFASIWDNGVVRCFFLRCGG